MKKQNKKPIPKTYTLHMYTLSSDYKITHKKVKVTEPLIEERFPSDKLYLSTGQFVNKCDIVDRNAAQGINEFEVIKTLRMLGIMFSYYEIPNIVEYAETILNDRINIIKANMRTTKDTLASCKASMTTCRRTLSIDAQKLAKLETMKVEMLS